MGMVDYDKIKPCINPPQNANRASGRCAMKVKCCQHKEGASNIHAYIKIGKKIDFSLPTHGQ